MSESQHVKPHGWTTQYAEPKGVSRWYDCATEELTDYAARGCKTRILYHYVDQPVLYAHPAPPHELVKAAEGVLECFDASARYSTNFEAACENLRSALDKVKP